MRGMVDSQNAIFGQKKFTLIDELLQYRATSANFLFQDILNFWGVRMQFQRNRVIINLIEILGFFWDYLFLIARGWNLR